MIDKIADKILNIFNKNKGNKPKDEGEAFVQNNDYNQQMNPNNAQYQNPNQNVQNYNQYPNPANQTYSPNQGYVPNPNMQYHQGMKKKNYNDPGFTDYPFVYIKSRWFFPVIGILILLIIIILIVRFFILPEGDLKGLQTTIPGVVYIGEENRVSGVAEGSGNLSHANFFIESSNDLIIEPSTKAGITGKNMSSVIIPRSSGTVSLSIFASLGGIKTNTNTAQVSSCYRLSKERLSSEVIDIDYTQKFEVSLDLGVPDICYEGLTYSISDTSYARVDAFGVVTPVNIGKVILTISQGSESIKVPVNIYYEKIIPTAIELNVSEFEIERFHTEKLYAQIFPENILNKDVRWSSSDESIATVNNHGIVTGVSIGDAVITATTHDGTQAASATVHVVRNKIIAVRGIALDETEVTIDKDSTRRIHAILTPTDATNQNILWSSSDQDIANVSSTGLITGYEAGTAIITATTEDGSYSASCTVTIR